MQSAVLSHSMLPNPHYTRQSLNGGPSVPPVGTRKRKRANEYTISYSEVQEMDSDGRLREVIVIDDTPPPTISPSSHNFSASFPPLYSAPIRTRARAAAEAQALSLVSAPAQKKRKRDNDDTRLVPAKRPAPTTQTKSATEVSCDDKEGHYIIVQDDMIYNRYRTVRLLGQGTFGKVVEAVDTHNNNSRVAIKIIRAIPKYRDASKIEIRVLQKLKERDPLNRKYVLFCHFVSFFLIKIVQQMHTPLELVRPPQSHLSRL